MVNVIKQEKDLVYQNKKKDFVLCANIRIMKFIKFIKMLV